MAMKLSTYYKENKRQIIKDWKDERVRGRHNYSMLRYIKNRIQDIIENNSDIEADIGMHDIETDLYKSL